MALKLQASIYHILILIFVLSLLFAQTALGQIAVKNSDFFEISFKQGQTVSTANMIRIGTDDPELRRYIGTDDSHLRNFYDVSDRTKAHFFAESTGGLSIGKVYGGVDAENIVNLSLSNSTGNHTDKLNLAFDFVYLPDFDLDTVLEFRLEYRIGNNEWVKPAEGYFSTAMLEVYEEGWNSFSLQITIDDLFIKPDQVFQIRWITAGSESPDQYLPVALQRLEISSGIAKADPIKSASIIISEILPRTFDRSAGSYIEYIELYNQTGDTLSLKGVSLHSDDRVHVIQRNLILPPYEVAVAGYVSEDHPAAEFINYRYSAPVLSESTGNLHLMHFEQDVAKATYQVEESGRALELASLTDAHTGYSSLQHFRSSANRLTSSIYGSPGRIQPDRKIFSKKVDQPGWHIINVPGVMSRELTRISGADYYWFNEESLLTAKDFSELPESHPIIIYNDAESVKRIYSKGVTDFSSAIKEAQFEGYRLTGNPSEKAVSLNRFYEEGSNRPFAAAKVWNSETQRFDLRLGSHSLIQPWKAVIMPMKENSDLKFSVDERDHGLFEPVRKIPLTLKAQSGSRDFKIVDNSAVIAFFEPDSRDSSLHPDLPKLFIPPSKNDEQGSNRSFIYLENHLAKYSANSLLSFNSRTEEPLLAGLGTYFSENTVYRIEWGELENFPEEWVVELRDELNDTRIDMKEETYYEFRARNLRSSDNSDYSNQYFKPYEPENAAERFFIYMSPNPELTGQDSQSQERAGSVLLNQNYPNPFNPATTITYYLPEPGHVRLAIYNVVGQQVGLLRDEMTSEGNHSVVWNAIDLPSGVYIVQLESGGRVFTRKITLIK